MDGIGIKLFFMRRKRIIELRAERYTRRRDMMVKGLIALTVSSFILISASVGILYSLTH
jgi:hypothetical protein